MQEANFMTFAICTEKHFSGMDFDTFHKNHQINW